MPLTENSNQLFLPGGCNRTQNLRFCNTPNWFFIKTEVVVYFLTFNFVVFMCDNSTQSLSQNLSITEKTVLIYENIN